MSDPFDRLRSSSPDVDAPSVDHIRSRARRIQRRRYVTVAASASVVVLLAGIGLFVRTNPTSHPSNTLAQQQTTEGGTAMTTTATPKALAPAAAPKTVANSNNASSAGAVSGSGSYLSPAQAGQAARPSAGLTLSLAIAKHSIGRGDDFTLKACNPSSSSFSQQMRAQTYDFEVSRGTSLVWQWSHGKAQPQNVTTVTWKPRECKSWSASWNGTDDLGTPVAPGTYQATGLLKTYPGDEQTKPQSFCLDAC